MNRREFLSSAVVAPLALPDAPPVNGMQLVLHLTDKTHSDPYVRQTHLKRGDVIDVLPIGAHPGTETQRLPHWMIVCVPGMSAREARALTTPEPGDRRVNPMLHARAFALDLAQLPKFGDGTERVTECVTVPLETIRAAKFRKAPARNPFVIG